MENNKRKFNLQLKHKFKYSNGTLRNNYSITDDKKLATMEYSESAKIAQAMLLNPLKIKSLNELMMIHKYMFGDLYKWAGKFRQNYNLTKGSYFLNYQFIPQTSKYINRKLHKALKIPKLSKHFYAELFFEINHMHPFREGNGRATKVFMQMLAFNHGQVLQYDQNQPLMIKALESGNDNNIEAIMSLSNDINDVRIHDGYKLYIDTIKLNTALTKKYKTPYFDLTIKYFSNNKYVTSINTNNESIHHTQIFSYKELNKILLKNKLNWQSAKSLLSRAHKSIYLHFNKELIFTAEIYKIHLGKQSYNVINQSTI